ncbi:DHHA1 domain-containing protein [[Kitasatospora] papulosa]|uniref:DHHA1 domain-containing protein n=1 Tax=[Kitasatospora] papulosa TaxID=1464011 RepID=UPI0036771105
MTLSEAKEIGALALFDETYGEKVRVVEIGGPWSRELCGGTHVEHASQIGSVALTAESAVGAGMRRMEAAVGIEGFSYLARERDLVTQIVEQVGVPRAELPEKIAGLLERLKAADRENVRLKSQATMARAAELATHAVGSGDASVVTATVDGAAQEARALAHAVRDRLPQGRPGVVAVATASGGLVLTVNAAARSTGRNAAEMVKELLGGRGGGSPETAQGGGTRRRRAGCDPCGSSSSPGRGRCNRIGKRVMTQRVLPGRAWGCADTEPMIALVDSRTRLPGAHAVGLPWHHHRRCP